MKNSKNRASKNHKLAKIRAQSYSKIQTSGVNLTRPVRKTKSFSIVLKRLNPFDKRGKRKDRKKFLSVGLEDQQQYTSKRKTASESDLNINRNPYSIIDVDVEKPDEKIIMTYVSEFKPEDDIIEEEFAAHSSNNVNNTDDTNTTTESVISSLNEFSKAANVSFEHAENLLIKTLQHLEKIHDQEMYASENYPLLLLLKKSVNSNLRSMLEQLISQNSHTSENVRDLVQKFNEVNDSINIWNDCIEANLPPRIYNIVKMLKTYKGHTVLESDSQILNDSIGSRLLNQSSRSINLPTTSIPLDSEKIKEIETSIRQFYTLKRTAKFNGIKLPKEYWQDLEKRVKVLENSLPNLKVKSNIREKEHELKKQINNTEERLKYWSSACSNLEEVVLLYQDYQKSALNQSKKLKSAEDSYNLVIKELEDTGISATSSEIASGLHTEITTCGQLLDEIIKNFKVFNRHHKEISENYEQPDRYKRSQYKQIKSELKATHQFLCQALSDSSKVSEKYEHLKNREIPILDQQIQDREIKLKKEKELSKQKRLIDTLKNWMSTVNKAIAEKAGLEKLEKLVHDYNLYIKPLYIKINDKSKVEMAVRVYESLKNSIHDLEENLKQKEFVDNLSRELDSIVITDDSIDATLTFLRLSIISALVNLEKELKSEDSNDINNITTPVLSKAKSIEAQLVSRKQAIINQDNKRRRYEELKSNLRNKPYVDENEFLEAFNAYAEDLPNHLVASLKLENNKLLRNYRNRIKGEYLKSIVEKLEKLQILLENNLLEGYKDEIKNLPEKLDNLGSVRKMNNTDPFLTIVDNITSNLNNMQNLTNELVDNKSENHGVILKTKQIQGKFDELNNKAKSLKEDISNLPFSLSEIEENSKQVESFLDEALEVLNRDIDQMITIIELSENLETTKDLLEKSTHYDDLITLTVEKVTALTTMFKKLKDLKFKEADILSLDFNFKEIQTQIAKKISDLEMALENNRFFSRVESMERYLLPGNKNNGKILAEQNNLDLTSADSSNNAPIENDSIITLSRFIDEIRALQKQNNHNDLISQDNLNYSERVVEKLSNRILELQDKFEREENSNTELARLSELISGVDIMEGYKFGSIAAVRNQMDVNKDYKVSIVEKGMTTNFACRLS